MASAQITGGRIRFPHKYGSSLASKAGMREQYSRLLLVQWPKRREILVITHFQDFHYIFKNEERKEKDYKLYQPQKQGNVARSYLSQKEPPFGRNKFWDGTKTRNNRTLVRAKREPRNSKNKVAVQPILQDAQTLVDNPTDDFTEPLIDPGNSWFH